MASGVARSGSSSASESSNGTGGASLAATSPVTMTAVSSSWPTPLAVRWPPSSGLAGRRVDGPTTPVDLARTLLDSLGLQPPAAFQGVDLASLAQGTASVIERPLAATRAGRFSVRWGPYVLMGLHERETRVCDLSLDPTCIADVRATSPLALEPIQRFVVDTLARRPLGSHPRTPATLDAHTMAALVRWGRVEDDHADHAKGDEP